MRVGSARTVAPALGEQAGRRARVVHLESDADVPGDAPPDLQLVDVGGVVRIGQLERGAPGLQDRDPPVRRRVRGPLAQPEHVAVEAQRLVVVLRRHDQPQLAHAPWTIRRCGSFRLNACDGDMLPRARQPSSRARRRSRVCASPFAGRSLAPGSRSLATQVTRATRIATSSSGSPGAKSTTASSISRTTSVAGRLAEPAEQREQPLLAEHCALVSALGHAVRPERDQVAEAEQALAVVVLALREHAEQGAADADLLDRARLGAHDRRAADGPAQATVSA